LQFRRVDVAKHYLSDQHQRVLVKFIRDYYKARHHQTTNITTDQLEASSRTIEILSEGAKVLERDLRRLAIESSHSQNALQPMAQELPNIKKSIGEQNGFVDGMENNQENGEQNFSSMKPLFENLRSSNYDGTMIWKITNVKDKIG
jgi:hypothetical protein